MTFEEELITWRDDLINGRSDPGEPGMPPPIPESILEIIREADAKLAHYEECDQQPRWYCGGCGDMYCDCKGGEHRHCCED